MAGTLYTYGETISGTAAYFTSFDTIAVSPDDPTGRVTLRVTAGVTADLSSQLLGRSATIYTKVNGITVIGSDGNDNMHSFSAEDWSVTYYGGGGDDVLRGGGVFFAQLYGGDGSDTLYAGRVESTLDGGDGDDTIYGGHGDDTVYGGAGNDHIDGGSTSSGDTDNDVLYGGSGNDVIADSWGTASIDGGTGDDAIRLGGHIIGGVVDGGEGIDTWGLEDDTIIKTLGIVEFRNVEILKLAVAGVSGVGAQFQQFEHITTTSATDTARIYLSGPGRTDLSRQLVGQKAWIIGSTGADDVTTSDGVDKLDGKEGDDILEGGAGADTIIGGSGVNTASYAGAASGVTVSLTTKTGTRGDALGDTLTQIHNLRGSAFGDELSGSAGGNRLEGLGGDDLLEGLAGGDLLIGGDGSDTATYARSSAAIRVDLGLNTGKGGDAQGDTFDSIENLIGSTFADTLIGDGGANVLEGLAGADGLSGGGGSDTASYSRSATGVRAALNTGKGSGGDAEGDTYFSIENLLGSAHADTLIGSDGVNRLDGAGGDDLISGRGGADVLVGGEGIDTATYNASSAAVNVNLATATGSGGDAAGDTLSEIENVIGSAYADTLTGDGKDNELTGGLGADHLVGSGGNDTAAYRNSAVAISINLATGAASGGEATGDTFSSIESVVGTAFADTIIGDGNANQFTGGAGGDVISGGTGSDTSRYDGSSAAVSISLTNGTASGGDATGDVLTSIENLAGSAFADTLVGNGGANRLEGGAGDDLLSGRGGADALIGGAGVNTVSYVSSGVGVRVDLTNGTGRYGDAEGDTLAEIDNVIGSAHADTMIGDTRANRLEGGEGDDVLSGRIGADTLIGGNGTDTATFSASGTGVRVDLVAGIGTGGDAEGDTYASIENINGSSKEDTLIGTAGVNRLEGGEGNDVLAGRQDGDTLIGGGGTDTASYGTSSAAIRIDLGAGTASGGDATGDILSEIESITGSAYADTLIGSADANVLNGGKGDDTLSGRAGADTLIGGEGIDLATYGTSANAVTVNLLTGTGLYGDAAGDTLSGIENLKGSAKGDTLIGDNAANRLAGDNGNDRLTGNGGADSFVFDTALGSSNIDTITDFTIGADRIELSKAIYSALKGGATPGSLAASSFRYSTDASTSGGLGEIIYNAATGSLSYDADGAGSGAARQFAEASTFLALSASDFRLA